MIFIELITVAIIDGVYDNREEEFIDLLRKALEIPKKVGKQAFGLIQNLVDTTDMLKNFIDW